MIKLRHIKTQHRLFLIHQARFPSGGAAVTGTTNEIEVSESVGNNGSVTIGLPDDVTIAGELTVSGTGQSSFAGQVTVPATPSANTDA